MALLPSRSPLGEAPDDAYLVHIVNTSDTTDSPEGTSFKITIANLFLKLTTAIGLNTAKRTYPLADETKLGLIEESATADQTDLEIKTAYENNADTNAYTDAEKTKLSGAEVKSDKDTANGYAGLDASSKINPLQLPSLAISETFVVATEVAQLALTVQEGDIAVRTDENKSYIALNDTNATMADWQELLAPTDQVASVFGRQGVVTAQNGDYTTDQVTEATDKRYMTDAQETNLDSQSGANSGDETVASIETLGFDAIGQTSIASSATPAPVGSEVRNEYYLTALVDNATFAAPSGTPANGNSLIIRIKGAAIQTLGWNAIFEAGADALPTATTAGKVMYLGFKYDSTNVKWTLIALNEQA